MRPFSLITTFACFLAVFFASQAEAAEFDSNGTKIHFITKGEGAPVVFLHGFMGSHREWTAPPPYLPPDQQANHPTALSTLASEFHFIAPDFRGHGASGKPQGPTQYGVEMVGDVIRLLDELGLEKAHVVGYSMGAFIAAKLAVMFPDRVHSVVLGGSGALQAGSQELAFMESLGTSLEAGRGVEPLIMAMTPPDQPKPTQEQVAQMNAMFLANQDELALAAAAMSHKLLTVTDAELEATQIPTLIIVGAEDPQRPAAETTHRLINNADLVVLDGMDHVSAQLSPEFIRHVRDFLKSNGNDGGDS